MSDYDGYGAGEVRSADGGNGPSGEFAPVPDVVGLNAVAAQRLLVAMGFGVGFDFPPPTMAPWSCSTRTGAPTGR
jgi:hypothetical protein